MHYRRFGAPLPEHLTGHALRDLCVSIPDAPEYRQAFWGQLWELGQEKFWEKLTPDDNRAEIAAQVWRDILSSVHDAFLSGQECDRTDTCQRYPNTASFIQYFPNDPRYTPDFVGEGYNAPAWYFATTGSNLGYGTQFGDIVTTLDRFPPGSLPTIIPASGLPRIRINVYGEGTVRLFLRNMIAGSVMQITTDDNPLSVFFVDMNRDIVSIPPETADAIAVDINLSGDGPHVIDAIVVSWLNDQIPFLHHGGGLVAVELCGNISPVEQEVPELTMQNYPIGAMVVVLDDGNVSDGLLLCNGQTVNRVDYPELYAEFEQSNSPLIIDANSFQMPNFAPETLNFVGVGNVPAYWCMVAKMPVVEPK